MRKIPQPTHTVLDVINCFHGRIQDAELHQRVFGSITNLGAAESDYQTKGGAEELYQIAEANQVGQVSLAEMKGMYDRFSRKQGSARHIYDAIKLLSPGGICPLCCQLPVSTLDHYLPQGRHAALTVTPSNLVPACKDCNVDTNERRPAAHAEQTLHPYYDEVDDEIWLFAELQQTTPPSVVFYVVKPESWPIEKYHRVLHHFSTFRLGRLYALQAARELVTYCRTASRIFTAAGGGIAGTEVVSRYFGEQEQDRRHDMLNTWQAALFQSLANSEWFCNGGFSFGINP